MTDRLTLERRPRAASWSDPTESPHRRARGPDFEGHVVALGALGIVTHLTLAVEPAFEVRQDVHLGLGGTTCYDHLDAILASTYSVSVFTDWVDPEATQVWLKSRPAPARRTAGAGGTFTSATVTTHMLRGGASWRR